MAESDTQLITYKDVINELEKSKEENHLLLGNGFNYSLGVSTSYKEILTEMKKENKEYEVIGNSLDLETFIGTCKLNIKAENNPYYEFMKTYFNNKVKKDFMKAITYIIGKKVKNIYKEKCEEVYLLLSQFTNYFTLNYDPFLYQLLMTFKKDENKTSIIFQNTLSGIEKLLEEPEKGLLEKIRKADREGKLAISIGANTSTKEFDFSKMSKTVFSNNAKEYFKGQYDNKQIEKAVDFLWKEKTANKHKYLEKVDDGFSLFKDGSLQYQHPETQNVFSLHGSFYIYKKGDVTYKIKQESSEALYKKIEKVVDTPEENLVCIFTDKDKLNEIKKDNYLMRGYNKLTELNGTLVIIGVSFSENDSHIFSQINKSNVETIYISSWEKEKQTDFEKIKKFFPNKKIILFDRETLGYEKVNTNTKKN